MSRLQKSLAQHAKSHAHVRSVEEAVQATEVLSAACGLQSQSRQALYRIGCILLTEERPTVLVPVCPDYGHEDGRYTFRSLGSGVPLLVEKHIGFLSSALSPDFDVHFLLADQEAEDAALCRAVGVSQEQFTERVTDSLAAIRARIKGHGWAASLMTHAVGELAQLEELHAECIRKDAGLRARVASDMIDRAPMYRRIQCFTCEEMIARTIRTMAQYRALGAFAAEHRYLVANHTTTNLAAYGDVGAALLHNPTSIY